MNIGDKLYPKHNSGYYTIVGFEPENEVTVLEYSEGGYVFREPNYMLTGDYWVDWIEPAVPLWQFEVGDTFTFNYISGSSAEFTVERIARAGEPNPNTGDGYLTEDAVVYVSGGYDFVAQAQKNGSNFKRAEVVPLTVTTNFAVALKEPDGSLKYDGVKYRPVLDVEQSASVMNNDWTQSCSWTSQDGKVSLIGDLHDAHLVNILRLIERVAIDASVSLGRNIKNTKLYVALLKEYLCRQNEGEELPELFPPSVNAASWDELIDELRKRLERLD